MRQTTTFREILQEVEGGNGRRVVQRAVLSNRIAKSARSSRGRRLAYAVKASAIQHAIRKFGDDCRLGAIEDDGRLFAISFRNVASLDIPTAACTEDTRVWLESERVRIVADFEIREAA